MEKHIRWAKLQSNAMDWTRCRYEQILDLCILYSVQCIRTLNSSQTIKSKKKKNFYP